MIRRANVAAEQLHSVAARFRSVLQARSGSHLSRPAPARPWRIPAHTDSAPKKLTTDRRLRQLEGILFLAPEPLTSRKLFQYASLADATEARTLVKQLNRRYDQRGCAFRVEEVAGGYQLRSRARFGKWIRRLEHVPPNSRLSAPALETLAVVAYRQPVPRVVVEAIRGVNCGEILRQLMDRDLICVEGRSEELGRPYLYGTTNQFLQVFGLRSLQDLPRKETFGDAANDAQPQDQDSAKAVGQTLETNEDEETDVSVTTTTEKQHGIDRDLGQQKKASPLQQQADSEDEDSWVDDGDDDDEDDDYDDEMFDEEEDDEEEDDQDELEDHWQEVEDDDPADDSADDSADNKDDNKDDDDDEEDDDSWVDDDDDEDEEDED